MRARAPLSFFLSLSLEAAGSHEIACRRTPPASQGAGCAAGPAPPALGAPDDLGVYTLATASGTLLLRLSEDDDGGGVWRFSLDGIAWFDAAAADSFWYSEDGRPTHADKAREEE